jgi:hypothetical protein
MTILSVVRDVCTTVGVVQPTSVFAGITGNRTMQEMVTLANEMAQRIAYDARDWTKLRAQGELIGDGVTTAFSLPANYKRMLLTSNLWRSGSPEAHMRFVSNMDQWMQSRISGYNNAWGEWTMFGGKIHLYPVLAVDEVATFIYHDKNCIDLVGGGRGDVFQNDLDVFTIDERLLKLGMIAQWKAQKGSPYAEDMGTFGDALTNMAGHDQPAPIILHGRRLAGMGAWYGQY